MQNPHIKYLKTPNGQLYLFYFEHSSIFLRSYLDGSWSSPQIIAENTSPMFSLCQFQNACYIFYSSSDGQLFLTTTTDYTHWEHRPMMQGIEHTGKTKFFMLPLEDAFHVIYHTPTDTRGVEALVYTAFRNGQWEKPYQIDRFMPFGTTPFLARRLSREHIILYYKTGRHIVSAREMLISPYTRGSLTPLFQTPSPCTDLSIVNDNERIHMVYIVRNAHRMQVVYQYKHAVAISTPRVIWEDMSCDNCIVFIENQNVVLMWSANGQTYRCISDNHGSTFGAVEKYMAGVPINGIKAELIGVHSDTLNAAECYGDHTRGLLPAILPTPINPQAEVVSFQAQAQKIQIAQAQAPNTQNQNTQNQNTQNQNTQNQNMQNQNIQNQNIQNQNMQNQNMQNQNIQNQNMQNQRSRPQPSRLQAAQSERISNQNQNQGQNDINNNTAQMFAAMKKNHEQKIEELTALLTQRSEEISSVNAQWHAHTTRLETQLQTLQAENQRLLHSKENTVNISAQSSTQRDTQIDGENNKETHLEPSQDSETKPAE